MGLGAIASALRSTTGRGVGPLLPKLWERLVKMDKEERRPKDDGWHISGISSLCPREMALKYLFPQPAEAEAWEPRSLMRLDVGSAVHEWWQNRYLGPANILMGDWQCKGVCRKTWKMSLMPARVCDCGGPIEYSELRVKDAVTGIVGSTDGILLLDGGRYGFDLKTSNVDSMERLKFPYESHVMQLNLYMHLLNLKQGLLVYVDPVCKFWRESKGRTASQGLETLPVLEFIIPYEPKWWDMAVMKVTEAKKLVEEIKAKTWNGPLPMRICESDRSFRAQDCSSCQDCFAFDVEQRVAEALAVKK